MNAPATRVRLGLLLRGCLLSLLLALAPAAAAEHLSWAFPLEPDHVARLTLVNEQGVELATFLAADGLGRGSAGWRPDTDPTPGQVAGGVELWLTPGRYTLIEQLPGGRTERVIDSASAGGRMLPVRLDAGAHGVIAWRRGADGGADAIAWAPAFDGGVTFLTVGGGSWNARQLGVPSSREDFSDHTTKLVFQRPQPPQPPQAGGSGALTWAFRLGVLPVMLLFVGLGGLGLWRARRMRGLALGAGVSLLVGLVVISPVLPGLDSTLLQKALGFTDPPDSVAQIAAVAEALPRLSDVSFRFDYPHGSSVLVNGPSLLGYLIPALLTWLFSPVVAHNLGIGLHTALLALAAWALARSLRAGPVPSLLAAIAPCLLPLLVDELHCLSIDRSTLFLVPVFFLCLHKAAEEQGWRWPLAAGAALAATFYGQLHYGLYLCAACPVLVLPRLVGTDPLRRLLRLGLVGIVGLVLMGPGLYLLLEGTAGTNYHDDQATLLESAEDLWRPVDPEQVETFLEHHAPGRSPNSFVPMDTPEDRLLTAVSRSLTLHGFLRPSTMMPAHRHYLPILLIALLAARRRRLALVASLDVLVLLGFSMGPLLRVTETAVSFPLPYYLDFLFIPGFEQLKQLNRYQLMALTVSAVPLALGLHGIAARLRERWAWARTRWALVVGVVGTGLVVVALTSFELHIRQPKAKDGASDGRKRFEPTWILPKTQPIAPRPVLDAMDGAAVLALPLDHPIQQELTVGAMRGGLRLVNEAPFGNSAQRAHAYWFENNELLSHAARLSGSNRAKGFGAVEDPAHALADLRAGGLEGVVLFRDLLAGPELAAPTEALLDAHLERVGEDERTVAWRVPAPP